LKNTVPLAQQTQAVAVCSARDTTRDINDEAWYDTTLDFYLGRDLAEDAYATLQQAGSEGHVYRGDIPHSQWVDAQYLKTGYRLFNPDNTWAIVTSVQVTDEPLTAYNLTVADYHTYFVAGQQHAPAVWVHNNCWEALPDGYKTNGQYTAYGQEIFQNKEGALVYKGNDGRYYNPEKYPPSSKSPNSGAMPENMAVQAENGLPYTSNPKHTPGAPGGSGASGKAAGIEPKNSLEIFNTSVEFKNKRYGVDQSGNIHQFTDNSEHDFICTTTNGT